jgi:hypothetical protein
MEIYKKSVASGKTQALPPTVQQANFSKKAIGKTVKKVADSIAESKPWKKVSKSKAYQEVRKTANDLYEVGKERGSGQKAADMLTMGATLAAGNYLVDKAIQADMKRSGIKLDVPEKEEKSKWKKIKKGLGAGAIILGTTGGTLILARKGKLNKETAKKVGDKLGTGLKNQFRFKDPKTGKVTPMSVLGPVATIGFPLASGVAYLTKKKQLKDQTKRSSRYNEELEEERDYSKTILNPSRVKRNAKIVAERKEKSTGKVYRENLKKALGNDIKKTGEGVSNFIFFGYNKKGRKELASQLEKQAEKSGGKLTKKLAKVVNPKHAILGIPVGLALMNVSLKPWEIGENMVKKPLKKIDKKAYLYEESQNENVD